MEWKDLLQELIILVENTAPHLWRIAIRQVYVEAIGYGMFSLLLFFGVFYLRAIAIPKLTKLEEDEPDWNGVAIFVSILFIIISALALLPTYSVIGRLINPEYYAIELLMNYVK